jgi:ribosomal protein S27E
MEPLGPRRERVCPDCRGIDFVEDHAAGDIICRVRDWTM